MIREACPSDVPAILVMAERFHALSPWAPVAFDAEAVLSTVAHMLGNADMVIFVADHGCGAVGMAGMMLAKVFFGAATLAQEAFWYCEDARDSLRLLDVSERWAVQRGAYAVNMARLEGVRDVALDKLYRRRGYVPNEHFYLKVL